MTNITNPLRKMKRNLTIATGAALGASFAMNGLFGWSLGDSLLTSSVMLAPALALEVFKAYAADNAAYHAGRVFASELVIPADRRYKPFMQTKFRFEHLAGLLVNVLFLVLGVLVSALAGAGFYAMTRGAVLANHQTAVAAYDMAGRTVAEEQAAINRLEDMPAFTQAASCPPGKTDFAFPANGAFCADYHQHVATMRAAQLVVRNGAPVNGDAQSVLFASLTGLSLQQVMDALTALFVVVSEALSGLGVLVIRAIDRRIAAEGETAAEAPRKPRRRASRPTAAAKAQDEAARAARLAKLIA